MARFSMIDLNRVLLAGRLTRDPELRYTSSGIAVATLPLAVSRKYTSKDGEKKEETCFINVVVWQKQAEFSAEYLAKGTPVFVDGRLQTRSWETETGQKRSLIEVRAQRIQILEWPDREETKTPATADEQVSNEEEVPF